MPRTIDPASYTAAKSLVFHELLLGSLPEIEPMTVHDYIRSIPNSRRRKAMITAYKKRLLRGENHKDYYLVNPFGKVEKLDSFVQDEEEPTVEGKRYVPRLIQATHDETHLDTGTHFKPLTSQLKKTWHADNWIFYGSVAPDVLDYWINKNADCESFFWSDYRAFDSTWTDYAFDLIETVYRRVLKDVKPEFWELLRKWRKPESKKKKVKEKDGTFTWIKYFADFCLASGRDDTALANALLNGLVLALSFAAALRGCKPSELVAADLLFAQRFVSISVVGDDSLVCCRFRVSRYMSRISENIASFGLQAKVFCSTNLYDVTYLGAMPYPVAGRYYWGPTVGRRLYKAFWQSEPIGNLAMWTKGVAIQLATYKHVPILSDIAQRIVDLLPKYSHSTTTDEYEVWTSVKDRPKYDESTLHWMAARYSTRGLTVPQIGADIRRISAISRLPAVVELPAAEIMVMLDDL